MSKKSFYVYTFGCRVNQAESEMIMSDFVNNGFRLDDKKPNFFIINSCAVTERAVAETRKLINKVKRDLPNTKIILTGCSANYWLKTQNKSVLKKLDYVVSNVDKDYLFELINKWFLLENSGNTQSGQDRVLITKYNKSKRILIKIQDGCHRFCSFCIVPYLRGLPKSYKISEIISSINDNAWAREAILTAINTEAYGKDTNESFEDLIRSVFDKTKIDRVSFGSIHPWSLTNEFINLYQEIKSGLDSNRFVDYFHIPLQSGSNKILSLMKRDYKIEEIADKIMALYKINPNIYFGTDIIVGFLEESEQDFESTYNILKKLPICKFHVFRYSNRKHTAAYYLSQRLKTVSDSVKKNRAKKLIRLGQEKLYVFKQSLINKEFSALVLSKKDKEFFIGVLSNQLPVLIKSDKIKVGQICNVVVSDLIDDNLISLAN
ncbi:MAG: tRNA (N(6)-L-threonylcarbamoyladenosine(37)-C(2))-methylthiotransferase MtaB [Patescibacteria group bacterium]|nr:MAG: tRNA (N(6)-L-threonylcarbamoyladenosine(37)-C(2))-methylthiotransferase MtaB [Patescibacteria group bacterium]